MYRLIASFIFITFISGVSFAFSVVNPTEKTSISINFKDLLVGDTLKLNDMVFANYFSPNGDGYNDTYTILNVENWTGNSIKIFNRWGEMVYQAEPYLNDWDGTNNKGNAMLNNKCTDGVYFFEFYDGIGSKINGTITLKR